VRDLTQRFFQFLAPIEPSEHFRRSSQSFHDCSHVFTPLRRLVVVGENGDDDVVLVNVFDARRGFARASLPRRARLARLIQSRQRLALRRLERARDSARFLGDLFRARRARVGVDRRRV